MSSTKWDVRTQVFKHPVVQLREYGNTGWCQQALKLFGAVQHIGLVAQHPQGVLTIN